MNVTQQELALYREGLYAVFNDGLKDIAPTWQAIVPKTITSKQAYEQIITHSGLGFLQTLREGQTIEYDAVKPRYKKTYTPVIRTLGIKWNKSAAQKDINNFIKMQGPLLAKSVVASQNLWAANILNTGGSTSGITSPDGVALFSSAHPLDDGLGNASNLISLSLSGLALETALQTAMATQGDRGIPIANTGGYNLIIPTGLAGVANRAAKSIRLQGTNDNDENIFVRSQIKNVHLEPFLGYGNTALAYNWFLVPASASENPFFYMEVQAPETDSDTEFDTRNVKMAVVMECLYDTFSWRGPVASIL